MHDMKSQESKTARQPAVRRKNKPANCPPSAAQSPVSWLSEIIRSRSRLTATIVGCTVIVGLALFLRPNSPDGDEFDIEDIDVGSLPEIIADDLSDQSSEDNSSAGQPGNPQHDSALGRLSVEKTVIGTPVDTRFFRAEGRHEKPGFLKKPGFWDETRQDESIRPATFEAHLRAAPAWLTGTIEEVIGEPAALADCGLRLVDCRFEKDARVKLAPRKNPQSAIRNPQFDSGDPFLSKQ